MSTMRITTEKRLERLEAAEAQEGVAYVVLDTLPDDEGGADHIMTEEQWQAFLGGADEQGESLAPGEAGANRQSRHQLALYDR